MEIKIKKVVGSQVVHPDGHSILAIEREHPTTPYIVCGGDPNGKPMLEHGFKAAVDGRSLNNLFQSCVAEFNMLVRR